MTAKQIGNNFYATYAVNPSSLRSVRALDDVAALEYLNTAIAKAIGSKIVKTISHKFQPIGVTSIAIISESHISLHSFPEYLRITVDIFSCNCDVDISKADACIRRILEIEEGSYVVTERF